MSPHSPFRFMSLIRLLFLVLFLQWLFTSPDESGVHSAPLSPRESANTRFFRNLLYSGAGFNRTLMYHKDDVTPELVKELRKDPDMVRDPPPLNITGLVGV